MRKLTFFVALLAFLSSCNSRSSHLSVHGLFSDNMVVQRNEELLVSGTATSKSHVIVEASWGERGKTRCKSNGAWEITIPTPSAGGPYKLEIFSNDTVISINNVLSGDVWLASGQSNMSMPLKGWSDTVNNAASEILDADFPEIRMFTVDRIPSFTQAKNVHADWVIAESGKIDNFSASSWFFAKKLHSELGVPIGIIHSSWGGTPAEAWTSKESLQELDGFEVAAKNLSVASKLYPDYKKWVSTVELTDLNTLKSKGNPYHFLEMKFSEFIEPQFNDSSWSEMNVPQYWESQEPGNYDGIIWYRKTFSLEDLESDVEAQLYLGIVDDMDETYINGYKLGSHLGEGYYNFKRKYTIPKGILKSGKNVLSIRVIDSRGTGGIAGEEDVKITQKGDELLILSGKWKYKAVAYISTSNVYWLNDENPMPEMPVSLSSHTPSLLFNGMISPLTTFPVKGFIWYQGESNVGRADTYSKLFPNLIEAWRKAWNAADLPFYYVQIAPWDYGSEMGYGSSELREAQRKTLGVPHTGMVVTMDIADTSTIHPGNKQDVGLRLALWALKDAYDSSNIEECSGPLIENVIQENGNLVLSFTHASGGLVLKDSDTDNFEIAGSDSVFYQASVKVIDEKLILHSEELSQPVVVRYLWSDFKQAHFFNGAGLPASPFLEYISDN